MVLVVLGLGCAGCATPSKKTPFPRSPRPMHAVPPPDTAACREACRAQLLSCQGTPDKCDQVYSDCLSRC